MPRDLNPQPRVTAWTTYEELTPDQRERFGGYVLAMDEARRRGEASLRAGERAAAALKATGGDKLAALSMLLAEGR
jgi:hypothetical protein